MKKKVLVSGSIAFDIIFSVPVDFRSAIPVTDGVVRNFNASYIADEKKEHPGGNAGNISWWLGREGVDCSVFTAYGQDFEQKGYQARLEQKNIDIRGNCGEFTAHAYMVSDPLHQQLIIWQPNSFNVFYNQKLTDHYSPEELEQFEYAIFSPGIPASFVRQMREFRSYNSQATIFFDPGQVSNLFSREIFDDCCEVADFLVANDIEFEHFRSLGISDSISQIETKGEHGVIWRDSGSELLVKTKQAKNVVETTGAGDAFRAGLIAGLVGGDSMDAALKNGCRLGAESVCYPSGQGI